MLSRLPSRAALLAFFGAMVATSGIYRKLSRPEGWPAFWFGVVVGATAVFAALLVAKRQRLAGYTLGVVALAFVVGWFGYECFIKKPWAEVEARPLAVLALGILTSIALVLPRRPADSELNS